MWPPVLIGATGCIRSGSCNCRTHISGMCSPFSRVMFFLCFPTLPNELCSSEPKVTRLAYQKTLSLAGPRLAPYFLDLKTTSLGQEFFCRHHGSNERFPRSECAIQEELAKCHRLSCCAVEFLLWLVSSITIHVASTLM